MILCDASPLVCLVNKKDPNHQRCLTVLPSLSEPLVTTWPCFTEAMYLLYRYAGWPGQQELWDYIAEQLLIIHISNESEQRRMQELMFQYRDTPMDLADASLVAAAETLNQQQIFTLDSDFYIYRLFGNVPFEIVP
ncbi:PIN domain nuclease [Aphanothece hegewaldii CCALA 016]|uniref:PIN domain nuclease n=1 Tax=Aphanothece hegewaldii CCALA 016 TaxID=2107694 RepID=A0A2T1LQG4_9CHRO|nr:PIN domain nuclease [Aphanothece hegewaldii CCALA 016]